MRLKVCGMKYSDNIDEVSQLFPDYMGFIFWKKSTRFFDGVIPAIPNSIQKVGVFVDETLAEILATIKKYDLNIVQLHGREDINFCNELKSNNVSIIKVFSMNDNFDFSKLAPFENACDYFLFDTKGKLPGGNGTAFNWEILKNYPSKKPLFLSGGIGIEDVEKIKMLQLPIHAIDVNSKFELEPGLKNRDLLKIFQNHI